MWEVYTFRRIYWKGLWLKEEKKIGYVASRRVCQCYWQIGQQEGKIARVFCHGNECETTVSACLCLLYLRCICCTLCVFVVLCVCIAVLTLDTGLLARSQYPEGPAIGHLDTGFSWLPCVYKRMLRWFPSFQVATTCLSCSPPDLNFLVTFFFPYLCTCKITTATGW